MSRTETETEILIYFLIGKESNYCGGRLINTYY